VGNRALLSGLLLAIAAEVGGCSSPATPTPAPARYQLHVLERTWRLEDGQTEETVSAALASETLDHDALTIDAEDITGYDWADQSLTLTERATSQLLALCGECQGRYFVATLDGRRLYGGAFWTPYSAIATRFTVIYAGGSLDQATLKLHSGPSTHVDLPEIHDYFKQLGKLRESPATG
jgi:hypothetical protein